jgi:Spy/CpxP family protein refolding chaperone
MRSIAVLITIFATVFACFSQEEQPKQPQKQREGLKSVLNMTPEQEEEFTKIRKESRSQDSVYYANLQRLRTNLLDESAKPKPDKAKINRIADEIGKQHSQLSRNMYSRIQKVREILTQEQFEKFIQYRKDRNNKNFRQKDGQSKQNR